MTRALLITNPAAARTDARAVTAIRDTLRRGGWSVDVLATAQAGDARRFAQEGRTQGFDVLVCYGGDGTAMQIAAGAAGSGCSPAICGCRGVRRPRRGRSSRASRCRSTWALLTARMGPTTSPCAAAPASMRR